jgi:hypothetical protein
MPVLLLFMSSLQQNWRIGKNRFCPEVRGVGGWEREGGGGTNGPNNVCTYEKKQKNKKQMGFPPRDLATQPP